MNTHGKILDIFDMMNIKADSDGDFTDIDSVAFVSLIVTIEETFNISFPDDLLYIDAVQSISNLEIIINNLLETTEQ